MRYKLLFYQLLLYGLSFIFAGCKCPPPQIKGPFYIYSDAGSSNNHFVPSGWMGDYQSIVLDEAYTKDMVDGRTSQKWTYRYAGRTEKWSGVIWQNPRDNWNGDVPNSGYDLSKARYLEFYVRGEKGGEKINFGFGGLSGQYPDSTGAHFKSMILSNEWTKVSIIVDDFDLSNIHNGFEWVIDGTQNPQEDIAFYLDEMKYKFEQPDDGIIEKISGLCFSPFTQGDPTQGYLASIQQVQEHMAIIAPYTEWIRTYSMDGGLTESGRLAHERGLKIAMGAWIERSTADNATQINRLIDKSLAGDADIAVIGNEALLRFDLSSSDLISLIKEFKRRVPNVPVTTAESYEYWLNTPALVDACDVIFAQVYPFWKGVSIDDAVADLNNVYEQLQKVAKGKKIYISETGWPSSGTQNQNALPSTQNASFYFLNVSAWAKALNVPYFYFEAFDEPFKTNTEPNGVGNHWGLFENKSTLKPDMNIVFAGHTIFDNWLLYLPGGPGAPQIQLTNVPPYGSSSDLRGRVLHVNPSDYAIAVYIYVAGGWWTKPYFERPKTYINSDGTFTVDITTGGSDQNAIIIKAFLIPRDYDPPLAGGGGLPSVIQDQALASITVTR
jgi:exo-beta-1,3-glucanase (GH17 family)